MNDIIKTLLQAGHGALADEAAHEIECLRKQLARFEAALQHYADESNWRWCKEHYEGGDDGTAVARAALENKIDNSTEE